MSTRVTPPSSLDLLLDAMCNVFGAVLFMAILLGGISTVRHITSQNGVTLEQLQQQQQQIKNLQSSLAEISARCKLLESIPVISNDLPPTAPSEDLPSLLLQVNTLALELDDLQQKLLAERQKASLQPKLAARSMEQLTARVQELQDKLSAQAPNTFTPTPPVRTDTLEPWRVLLTKNEIFIIGGNRDIHLKKAVGGNINITSSQDNDTEFFHLTKVIGKGIKLKDFTLQKLQLPNENPGRYFIEILAEGDCIVQTAQLIQALQAENIAYNWRIVPTTGATLRSSLKGNYEVAR